MVLSVENKIIQFDDRLYEYLVTVNGDEHPVMRQCREETAAMPESECQISREQAAFLRVCLALSSATRCVEIGVFTGYSSLCTALALPSDGKIFALDISEEWTARAKKYWQQAGVAGKIELRIGPGVDELRQLSQELAPETIDFAFVDADKISYDAYYEGLLPLIRPGGLILFDNALRGGRVAAEGDLEPDTAVVRDLNSKAQEDGRVETALVNIADGLLMAVKRR